MHEKVLMDIQNISGFVYSAALSFSTLINSDLAYFLLTILLAYLFTMRAGRQKQIHLAVALLAAFALAILFKQILAVPRPCQLGLPSLISCPSDFSMPSIHAAVAFALAISLIGRRSFWPAIIWAILVSCSRLFLGLHTPADIFGAMAVAVLAVALADRFIPNPSDKALHHRRRLKIGHVHHELARKSIQMALGLMVLSTSLIFGIPSILPILALLLFAGILLFHLKAQDVRIPYVDALLIRLERADAAPGLGALTFVSGMLFSLALLPAPLSLAAVYILAVSDSVASLAGQGSKHQLPHNAKKSFHGSLAFILSGLPVYLLAGSSGLVLLLIAAMLESLPSWFDDNLSIPLAGIIVLAPRLFG